jgi:nucleolar GTP-binding protein
VQGARVQRAMGENVEKLPWLQRHVQALRMVETSKRLKSVYVYSAEEIVRTVGERYRRVRRRRPGLPGRIEFEIKRLETVFNIVYSRLRHIAELPSTREMSEFHKTLVEMFVGEGYDRALRRVRRALRLVKSFWNEYRLLIASAETGEEAARLRKEGSGRILSVVRRLKRDLELLRRVRSELLKAHVIAEGLPVVVVAGIPSTGKSTLIKRLSTAEPEVASYPFTTKNIIVGKVRLEDLEFYMVDTPGILERPSELHNEIERKALAALKTLPDVVLFLLDPSLEKVQDVSEQVKLLRDIYENIVKPRGAGLLVAINKADITAEHELSTVVSTVSKVLQDFNRDLLCTDSIHVISALTGYNVDRLLKSLAECVKRKATWLFKLEPTQQS